MPRIQVDYYSFSLNMNTHATVILPQTGKDFCPAGCGGTRTARSPFSGFFTVSATIPPAGSATPTWSATLWPAASLL